LKQFAKTMGLANYSVFNKWKKVWVAGNIKKMHQFIILGQNQVKLLSDRHLCGETVVADVLLTFENWLWSDNFHNAEWISWQWVEMFLKKHSSKIQEARKQARRGNKQPATDWGEHVGKKTRCNLPESPTTAFKGGIHRESNWNDMVISAQ